MIDDERLSEVQFAYEVLVKHNLWRRGYCCADAIDVDPKTLGIAIDVATGALLDYIFAIQRAKRNEIEMKKKEQRGRNGTDDSRA